MSEPLLDISGGVTAVCTWPLCVEGGPCCNNPPRNVYDQIADVATFHYLGFIEEGKLLHKCQELVEEEFKELQQAWENKDEVKEADSYLDLAWTCFSALIRKYGEKVTRQLWAEVARANLDKVSTVVIKDNDKIQKPTGWVPPDIEGILAKCRTNN